MAARSPLIPHAIRIVFIVVAVVLLFAGLLIAGIVPRRMRSEETKQAVKPQLVRVSPVHPKLAPSTDTLMLPGDMQAYLQTSIYSRTNGILLARYVDIGDYVRENQVLATIYVPDLDQELDQAKAALNQAQADVIVQRSRLELARISLNRWLENAKIGGVSQQDIDQRRSDYLSAQASLKSSLANVAQNRANVRRILALESYKKILAPFSGFITQRNVDPGANIVSGGSSTSTNLFNIAQTDRLRIFVSVPQTDALLIHTGMPTRVTIPELPRQIFQGIVTRFAKALDPKSRTLLTEVQVKNPDHRLYPGLYSQVYFELRNPQRVWLIPDTALVINAAGVRVITVTPDHRLHYKTVTIGRDFGTIVQVIKGLNGDELLLSSPTDALQEGQLVQVPTGQS